ncbi:MAG: amidase [Cytophagia bacterium]|nr:amidase [Cytophagia bacterium]
MLKRTLSLLLAVLLIASCKPSQYNFTSKDIAAAQKLYGFDFEEPEIDSMYNYLGRNKAGYDNLREYEVDNETFPALTFDPHPSGFVMPTGKQEIFQASIPTDVELPATDEEIAFLNIPQLASLIKSRKITSERLTNIYLDRIEKFDGQLEAVITVTRAMALEQAKKADAEIVSGNYRGILHGIPYGVKDLMAVKGYPTTWGAEPYRNQRIEYTSTVVNRLSEQGAVLIAKLVSGSLARGDVWFGGQTKNPWDLSQGASGSSAGSGSATSAGLVAFSLGTETLGSITSPATRNGVTGLRPTYGRISRHGVMSLSWSMDKVGPICRSAEDCEIVLAAIYGKDPLDPTTNDVPFMPENSGIEGLKIAKLGSDIESDARTQRGKNVIEAVELLEAKLNGNFDTLSLPRNYPYRSFDIILRAEAGAFFDELVRSGAVDNMVEQHQGSRAVSLRQARFIPAVEYLQANRERRRLIEEINTLFKDYDVIIAPSARSNQLQITNLTGHPVISVPTGFDERGRPTSMTLIGNLYQEDKILQLAKYYQSLTEFDEKHPPLFYSVGN